MMHCRICDQEFGEDLVRSWTLVSEPDHTGYCLYSTGRYGQVHDVKKIKKQSQPVPTQIPAEDLSGLVTETEQPQLEPVGYFMRRRVEKLQ
jgi:hypothetical protein